MNKKIIIYIIVIIIILVAVFFSQQAVSRRVGQTLVSAATNQLSAYLAKGPNLAIPNIESKINDGLASGEAAIKNSIDQGKQKISDAEKNIQNYFSGIKDAVAGKQNTCVEK